MVILRIFIFSLLFPSAVFALVTKYVNTDCANNGDGTASSCAVSSGATGAYKTQQYAATAYDGATLTDDIDINCRGDAVDGAVLWTNINQAGHYIHVYADATARHAGVWDDSKYTVSSSGYDAVFRLRTLYFRIEGIQIYSTCASGDACHAIKLEGGSGGGEFRINDNIMKYYNATPGQISAIRIGSGEASTKVIASNNIIYGFYDGIWTNSAASDAYIFYNNTIVGNANNALSLNCYGATDSLYLVNNILGATGNDFYLESSFTTYVHSKNITLDATSPDVAYRSKTITFAGASDYHLASTETDAIGQGDDLSADAQYAFSTDIDGQTRTGTWDIGADEYQAAAAAGQQILTLRALGY